MDVKILLAQLPLICVFVVISLLAYILFKIRKQKQINDDFGYKKSDYHVTITQTQKTKGIDVMTVDELYDFMKKHGNEHGISIDGLLAMLIQVQKITETNPDLGRNYVFLRNLSILALFFDDCAEREQELLKNFSPYVTPDTVDAKVELYEDMMEICFNFQITSLKNKTMVFNTNHRTLVMKDSLYSGVVNFHVFPLNETMQYALKLGLRKKPKIQVASQN